MERKTEEELLRTAERFDIGHKAVSCVPYGGGHINGTWLVQTAGGGQYILQTVNTSVFTDPEAVMENIERVSSHLLAKGVNPREVMRIVRTVTGENHYTAPDGSFFRMLVFVPDSICLSRPASPADFRECALAFGRFQKNLADFPAAVLHETIPDFHHTPKRYAALMQAAEEDCCGRAAGVRRELDFARAREKFCSVLLDAAADGRLPLRVSHNDTKSDNVLLDAADRTALCVIDLDTIMPGFSVTDFGDAIRFGANTAAEDERDLRLVGLDLEMFDAYADGFLEGCGGSLPDSEILLLPEGAMIMTLENGMRFLTDYLRGDVYYRTEYPDHNLVRCRTQFRLLEEMERHLPEMRETVRKYCRGKEAL